jgi:hypothetical protein
MLPRYDSQVDGAFRFAVARFGKVFTSLYTQS